MTRFLIIQTAFLGDVILCTPIIGALKQKYPNAKIDIIVKKGNESLLKNNPHLDTIITFDKSKKIKNLISIIRKIRKNKYNEVINLQRFTSAGIITLFSGAKRKIGFDKNWFSSMYNITKPHMMKTGIHEVNRNLSLIEHHQINLENNRPQLFPSKEDYNKVKDLKHQTYFCIAPASVWQTKQLPTEKWIELIKILATKGEVYALGAPSDFELINDLNKEVKLVVKNLAGKLSLLQSAALMQDAAMNFVNDSGPLHLASSVNANVRAFFCSTISDFGFGPLSEDGKIIETQDKLSCRPCGVHGHKACPEGHFKCGYNIKIDSSILA